MKRKLPCLIAALILLAGALFAWHWPRSPVTRANCDKIKEGMTPAEVEAIMGCPPGNYCSRRAAMRNRIGSPIPFDGKGNIGFCERWFGEASHITVSYLKSKVLYAQFHEDGNGWEEDDGGVFERVREWLGW